MKITSKIMGMFAGFFMMMSLAMTAAAEQMAGVVDYSNPFSNIWVIFALLAAIIGFLLIFMAISMKGEKKSQQTVWGVIAVIVAAALFMVAVYVPDDPTTIVIDGDITTATAYDLILNPANDTTLGNDYATYYTWGDVEVNMTANTVANATGQLTFNITISRTSGATTDKVRCYISEANIPQSDLGYDVIAKSSGVFAITWTSDSGTAVTGLNKLPISFPADSEVSAHFVTCAVTLSNAAMNDLADNNVPSTQFTMTFESDEFGTIGNVPVTIYGNYWA